MYKWIYECIYIAAKPYSELRDAGNIVDESINKNVEIYIIYTQSCDSKMIKTDFHIFFVYVVFSGFAAVVTVTSALMHE